MNRVKAHFLEAIREDRSKRASQFADRRAALIGAIGISAPLLAGIGTHHLTASLAAGLGALATSTADAEQRAGGWLAITARILAPAALAVFFAWAIPDHTLSSQALLLGIAALSTIAARYSKAVAMGSIRFMIWLVIFAGALADARSEGTPLLILAGALWAAAVTAYFLAQAPVTEDGAPSRRKAESSKQRLVRLRAEIAHLAIWSYPLRLAAGFAASLALRLAFPSHHFIWVTITVALLTPRLVEGWPLRATQRALGTVVGVLGAAALLAAHTPAGLLVPALICLSALRLWWNDRNYFAYSAVMTALILLLGVESASDGPQRLFDRVAATMLGVLLIFLTNTFGKLTSNGGSVKRS